MRFSSREAIIVLLLLSLPLGVWWFIFRPGDAYEARMLDDIRAKQEKLIALHSTTKLIGNLKDEIVSLEKAVSFFQSKLPNEKEIDKVLKELWLLAEANQLTTKSIRTLQTVGATGLTTPQDPHCEQPIAMDLEGDFRGLYSFLLAMENQPRIMRLRQMELKKLEDGPEGAIRAECEMSIFFEKSRDDASLTKGSL